MPLSTARHFGLQESLKARQLMQEALGIDERVAVLMSTDALSRLVAALDDVPVPARTFWIFRRLSQEQQRTYDIIFASDVFSKTLLSTLPASYSEEKKLKIR